MKENTAETLGQKFNGKYYPQFKKVRTEPRQKIRQKLRGFFPLHLELFADSLPQHQSISRRNTGLNPSL
ncbi:hypothetical protein [Pedobacter sp. GR22-6]|uniref:hypothetical protein n=1 Tax=Pedobacter sp. GR22-6 TaxID=3127957 RepID=UPI00307E4FB3